MKVMNLKNFTNNWIIGDFAPSIIRTKEFEIAVVTHEKGFQAPAHKHNIATEINVINKGHMIVNNTELKTGDIFIFEPGELGHVAFLEDTNLTVIKVPSIPSDKVAPVVEYWNQRFTKGVVHHSEQNAQISKDFIQGLITSKNLIHHLLLQSPCRVIEIGCGTGELCKELVKYYNCGILGTDISPIVIELCNRKYINLNFKVFNILTDKLDRKFDIAIASNVLEHFKNPYNIIDKMLKLADFAVIIVPYKQPCTDGYEDEGGAGHVFTFYDDSFKFTKYKIIEKFTFASVGWQHSSKGETPLQLCVCLQKRG